MSFTKSLVVACLLAIFAVPSFVFATTYDARLDFNTSANPTPLGWQYENGAGLSLATSYSFVNTWDWGSPPGSNIQSGWHGPGADHEAVAIAISRVDADTPLFDLDAGDLVSHARTSVAFVASGATAGTYNVNLSVWSPRPSTSRTTTARLFKNGVELVSLNIGDTPSKASPAVLANNLSVTLAAGDVLRFKNDLGPGGDDDFMGINFSLTSAAIPEPGSVALAVGGGLGLIGVVSRRRRRSRA